MDYHNQNNVAIKIIQILMHGPNTKPDGRVVSNFIVQALQEKYS
jgi:hypothetical protein